MSCFDNYDSQILKNLVLQGESNTTISKLLGLTVSQVRVRVKRDGLIGIRPAGGAHHKPKPKKPKPKKPKPEPKPMPPGHNGNRKKMQDMQMAWNRSNWLQLCSISRQTTQCNMHRGGLHGIRKRETAKKSYINLRRTKMQGYICGIADNSRINYCPHCGAELGVYAYYGDGSVVCDECDLHFAVIECEEEE